MRSMTSKEIRQAFLDYFASKDHEVVASSALLPAGDSTLLFTNA
jgi:alanyl-tRNA synthetase